MFKNEPLFQALTTFLPKVLPLINPAIKDSFLPRELKDYPVLSYKKNGFPSFTSYPSKPDISAFFRPPYNDAPPKINLETFEEYEVLLKNLMTLPEIEAYYRTPNKDPEIDKWFSFACKNIIETFVERYFYIYGDSFKISYFSSIYLPIEKYIYAETINFDISIPILFVQFENDYFELQPGIAIRKISDEIQRARWKKKAYSPAILESVMVSATHELVLQNYNYKKPSNFFHGPFEDAKIYPHPLIEKFFTTLKIATDFTSGYAQLLIHPIEWADRYDGDILSIKGTSVRNYPSYFDDYYWNLEVYPIVTESQLVELKRLFEGVIKSEKNQIAFALKRFYKSTLRAEEEDIIVDLIIALEMLLSDSEKSEITHKLALRISALLSLYQPDKYDALTVFANVKKIYAYRSSIVHGSQKTKQKKEIQIADNTSIPIVNLSNEYLRAILSILIHEPKYLNPAIIDNLLLTGNK